MVFYSAVPKAVVSSQLRWLDLTAQVIFCSTLQGALGVYVAKNDSLTPLLDTHCIPRRHYKKRGFVAT